MSSNNIKNALVTGAANRLGAEIAISLASQGWNVAVHHNTSSPQKTLDSITAHGVKSVALNADFSNAEDVQKLIPQAAKELGEITLLVNSASIFERLHFAEVTPQTFDANFAVHVKAPFILSQNFAAQTKNGHIINIVDAQTLKTKSTYFDYLLSKKSLRELSMMMASVLGPNIRVNSILPGPIKEFGNNLDVEYRERREVQLPMQNFCRAADITGAIKFLIESNLTGQEIFVDGGESLLW